MNEFWEKYGLPICTLLFVIGGMICSIDAIICGNLFFKIIGSLTLVGEIGIIITAIKKSMTNKEDE